MEDLDLNLFGGTYAGRRVLVTGHTGFKGSWLTYWLHRMGANVAGLALDPDTDPSHWQLLKLNGVPDFRIDLTDGTAVNAALQKHRPEIVFHLAAQPLVRRSYRDPIRTFASNVTGLVSLLEAVRLCSSVRVVVSATTDKVYAENTIPSGYCESDPLGGHDPYSTSKACAELVSECYRKSFFASRDVRIATARAGNVIGGGDWAEDRLVPDLVRSANRGRTLTVRNPSAVRPWQHVLEPLSGYLLLGQSLWNDAGFEGAWNFGPGEEGEVAVQELCDRLLRYWRSSEVKHDVSQQPHEALVLRLNCNKANRALGWKPVWNLEAALDRTANWYRDFQQAVQINSADDLSAYVCDARRQELRWAV